MVRHQAREEVVVGRHRVRRLMRLMGLVAICRMPHSGEPIPEHCVYPYLLCDLVIDRPDQFWCAYIMYIPVLDGFSYLSAVMDWVSRNVLSWQLSNAMEAGFCIMALESALRSGSPEIFNTDQGSWFTSIDFSECADATLAGFSSLVVTLALALVGEQQDAVARTVLANAPPNWSSNE